MTNLEILFLVLGALKPLGWLFILSSFTYIFVLFVSGFDPGATKCWKYFLATFLIGLPLVSAPSVDRLWEIRIGLIKYELASHENIAKGAEVIERMGKKLECKYLGCEETKEK